jgi:NAD(P)H dehydrogenase (quinone)
MAKALVVYCHPSSRSHNARILQNVRAGMDASGTPYTLLDLYELDFPPCLTEAEYEGIKGRRSPEPDPVVAQWQAAVTESTDLVFIYPVWWYGMPARLKGFVDRVFTRGFAYRFRHVPAPMLRVAAAFSLVPGLRYVMQPTAAEGLLRGKRAWIFRSFGGPKLGKRIFGNLTAGLEHALLRFCGITKIRVHELYNVDKSEYTQDYEDAYMAKARRLAARIGK